MNTYSEKAAEVFGSMNCAQAVFSVFSEKYGLPRETALKIAAPFGSGMRSGEVCGAVSGALMVIGLKAGPASAEDKESKSRCYAETEEFLRRFRAQNGSILCRELLGCDLSTAEGREKAQQENLFSVVCTDVVRRAAAILEEMGY